jgi:hypothetical protein
MPATDKTLLVLQRLVALVSAPADFWAAMMTPTHRGTRPVNNFVHSDEVLDRWKATRVKRGPAAFPAVFLAPAQGREAPGAVTTLCDRYAQQVQVYQFRIVGEGTEVVTIGQVAAEIEAAVRAAGHQLGIPATVATSRYNGRTYQDAPRDLSPDAPRRAILMNLDVTIK